MATTLKFSLDSIEEINKAEESLYEKVKKSRFSKVKIKLFGTGENAHTEPVDFEALKKSADSAYDIPLIAELNPYRMNNDFGGHGTLTGKQFSFGFIKESKDNPIVFEKDEKTGKIFITLYGLIWKKYFKNVVEILLNNDSQTEVSVELDSLTDEVSENGKPILKQFVLNAVTFLGKITTAACQGAMAQLAFSDDDMSKFAQDKQNYLEGKFEDNSIEISNDVNTAVNGKWSNPRQKLLAPILKASNTTELLNEAYLFWEEKNTNDITVSDVSYPHHIIKNGELVLHIKGVQAAFARLAQQGKDEGKAKAHLIRHYKTLGLNRDNFEDFGLTSEQFELYFSTEFGKEEIMSEETKVMDENLEIKEEIEITEENLDLEVEPMKESTEVDEEHNPTDEEQCDEKMEDTDKVEDSESHDSKDDKDSEDEVCDEDDNNDDCDEDETKMSEEPELTFEELKAENEQLKKDNEAYMAKIAEMSDYEDLKTFKEETLEKEAKMAEAVEMAKVMTALEDKGVKMSEQVKEELTNARENFANTSAWANYVKAYVFDNCELSNNDDGIIKFDIIETVNHNQESDGTNVWASLKNKFRK